MKICVKNGMRRFVKFGILSGWRKRITVVFTKNVGGGNRIRCGSWAIRCVDVKKKKVTITKE